MIIYWYETQEGLFQRDKIQTSLNDIFRKANVQNKIILKKVQESLKTQLEKCKDAESFTDIFADFCQNNKLIIATDNASCFAQYCQTSNPHALWGGAIFGVFAVEYAPESNRLFAQLHELLHILNVKDCYNEVTLSPKSTCNNPKCVMHYATNSTEVCDNVIKQIQNEFQPKI